MNLRRIATAQHYFRHANPQMQRTSHPTPPQKMNFLSTAKPQGIEATFKTRLKIQRNNFGRLSRLEASKVGCRHRRIENPIGILRINLNISYFRIMDNGLPITSLSLSKATLEFQTVNTSQPAPFSAI